MRVNANVVDVLQYEGSVFVEHLRHAVWHARVRVCGGPVIHGKIAIIIGPKFVLKAFGLRPIRMDFGLGVANTDDLYV